MNLLSNLLVFWLAGFIICLSILYLRPSLMVSQIALEDIRVKNRNLLPKYGRIGVFFINLMAYLMVSLTWPYTLYRIVTRT